MLKKLSRILKYRLLVPILRSNLPPVETARGVAVGLVSAMNPFVGIQMALVGAFWAFQKLVLPNWRFNLIAVGMDMGDKYFHRSYCLLCFFNHRQINVRAVGRISWI